MPLLASVHNNLRLSRVHIAAIGLLLRKTNSVYGKRNGDAFYGLLV